MNRFNKVIFVCMGNTCRSPMAATIMSNLMPDMRCESRGVVVLFPEPYNPKAVAVASRHGMIMPSNVSVQIANEDFSIDTLVLTMQAPTCVLGSLERSAESFATPMKYSSHDI